MSANSSKSSDRQSESMGHNSSSSSDDDDEEIIPMKSPQNENDAALLIPLPYALTTMNNTENDNDANNNSFLDEDFLSFGHVDNGGEEVDDNKASSAAAAAAAVASDKKGDGYKNKNFNSNKLTGKNYKRERPHEQYNNNSTNNNTSSSSSVPTTRIPSIPWLDSTTNNSSNTNNIFHQSQQYSAQNHQGYNNRGYSDRGYNNNNHRNYHHQPYYNPPTPPLLRLHNEIVSFTNLMSPTPQEIELRSNYVSRITELAHRVFGQDNCEVLPFGSQVTGLALPGSDIDFVIRFPKKDEGKRLQMPL